MPYKKLSGMQRLRKAQAERKRRKIASEKKGKDELTPLLVPLHKKLRTATPAQRRRISKPKGGQRLMDLAKRRKPAVKKKPASKPTPPASKPGKGYGARSSRPRPTTSKTKPPKPKTSKTGAYARLLEADRNAPLASGPGFAGGTIRKTDPRWSAAHGPGATRGTVKRAKGSTLGRLLDLPIDEGLIAGGPGAKAAAATPRVAKAAAPAVKAAGLKSKEMLTEAKKLAQKQWRAYKRQLKKEKDAEDLRNKRSASSKEGAETRRRNAAARKNVGSPTGTLAERRAWRRRNKP